MRAWIGLVLAATMVLVACEPRSSTRSTDDRRHVVFDTDLAFDDIMALLYLLQRDDVTVDAVTITGTGEAHCDPGVDNAAALLALGGSPHTPVACGRETPLDGTNAFPDEWRTAVDDLSMLDLPEVEATPDPRGAVGVLRDTLDGEATLITLGPLTNVAEALREDPGLADRVPTFVAMAGAVDVPGNAPGGIAEYNVWVDPLAAKEVIEGMDVTLVPLDATNHVPFSAYFVEALEANLVTPEAEAVAAIIHANEEIFLSDGYSFWDTLATALVFREELATWIDTEVSVTGSAGGTAGWIDRAEGGAPVRFASDVPDPIAFESEYLSTITGVPVDASRPPPSLKVTFDGDRCQVDPMQISAGTNDGLFAGPADIETGAVLISFADDAALSYRELRALVGPPGSVLNTQDPALERVAQIAFLGPDLVRVDIAAGAFAAACFEGGPTEEDPPRVWLSKPAVAS